MIVYTITYILRSGNLLEIFRCIAVTINVNADTFNWCNVISIICVNKKKSFMWFYHYNDLRSVNINAKIRFIYVIKIFFFYFYILVSLTKATKMKHQFFFVMRFFSFNNQRCLFALKKYELLLLKTCNSVKINLLILASIIQL